MNTRVYKTFNHGFVLSEQSLRRIANICLDQLEKLGRGFDYAELYEVFLKNGHHIESDSIHDIILTESTDSKQVEAIRITFVTQPKICRIEITFQNALVYGDRWISIKLKIDGQDRDWTFVTAFEIEEVIKRIKILSIPYVTSTRWFAYIPSVIAGVVFIVAFSITSPYNTAVELLEQAYQEGSITDPIEAIILLEKARRPSTNITTSLLLVFLWITPVFISFLLIKVATYLYPAYNFYWGDYCNVYDKIKNYWNIFFTVILLGVLASIIASYIYSFLTSSPV